MPGEGQPAAYLWRHYALSRDWMRMCAHTCPAMCMYMHVHVHVHTSLELG